MMIKVINNYCRNILRLKIKLKLKRERFRGRLIYQNMIIEVWSFVLKVIKIIVSVSSSNCYFKYLYFR